MTTHRRFQLFFIACLAAIGHASPGFAACVTAPPQLVAWWRAEGNALDSAGANHGTLQDGASFGTGRVGQAFSLNGAGASVFVSDAPTLHFTSQFTLESWVNPADLSQSPMIFSRFGGATASYELHLQPDGSVRANVSGDGTTYDALISGASLVATGAWTHVATTFNSGTWKLFVNGVEVASRTSFVTTIFTGTAGLLIGRDTGSTHYFSGLIDEPSVYNRALSTNEIATIFTAGSEGKCPPLCVPVPSGAVAWWRAENNAFDQAGTNNGTLVNGATFAPGLVGQAFRFDGVNDYIEVGGGFNLDDLTLEAWVLIDPATNIGEKRILSKDNDGLVGTRKAMALKSSVPSIAGGQGCAAFQVVIGGTIDSIVAPFALTVGWHHLAGVRDTNLGRFELYVDGVLVANKSSPSAIGPIDSVVHTVIGQVSPTYNGEFFAGLIDEPALYNRALSAAEIQAIFNAGSAGKCAAPALTIFRSTTNTAVVSWPSPSTGFGLQQNTNGLNSVNWSNVAVTPVDTGTNKFIIVNPPAGTRFYRLLKP